MHVALYARVSTTRQAENDLSIPDQLRQLHEWAKANGHLVIQEYVEPGASATDDKRPVFQQMITDAMIKPPAFEAIIIHSLSRFFRDGIQFGVYERKLDKNKIKVVSITQPTSDDAGGEMMRRIINLFDEHQSKENSKHVSRAMKENARQGFFNGSKPPFGYQAVATNKTGSRGRSKKKLEINEAEAGIVRLVYEYYLHGLEGRVMGFKEITKHLTEKGLLMRGSPWNTHKIHTLLSDTLYIGDYYFNVVDSKAGKKRPQEEWIKTAIPAIIDAASFEQVRARREARAPSKTPPRRVSSPTLLTGLLKCGICDHAMTLVTGKSGKYRYYKCTSRHSQGNHACTSGNLPMEKFDELVLDKLADQVFAPERLQEMMAALRKHIQSSKNGQQARINELNRQIKQIEKKQENMWQAIENGMPCDDTFHRRAQQFKAAREALFIELAGVRRDTSVPAVEYLKASQVDVFGKVLRQKLLAKGSPLAKSYLNILVDEIVIVDKSATIKGSYAALADTMQKIKKGNLNNQVPSFMPNWCARSDSNALPLGS
ncbi:recombinase family protein [Candidatus Nitrotoga sp. M5]|uniref:recombinase family protein n=1 Tax=Candidatus Nitrotoga sp. M5 TaxID=2890409 RepID=UPI001EF2983A|nr:recombinase family protein [Candidatus Nitrotoga sp. M5]CAH1386885.1 Site-specific DNA recombinase [Candidatus Nitrotoga sp. M5]